MDLYALRDITKSVINMTLYLCLWRGWSFGAYYIATKKYLCLREMSLNWIKKERGYNRRDHNTGQEVYGNNKKKYLLTNITIRWL